MVVPRFAKSNFMSKPDPKYDSIQAFALVAAGVAFLIYNFAEIRDSRPSLEYRLMQYGEKTTAKVIDTGDDTDCVDDGESYQCRGGEYVHYEFTAGGQYNEGSTYDDKLAETLKEGDVIEIEYLRDAPDNQDVTRIVGTGVHSVSEWANRYFGNLLWNLCVCGLFSRCELWRTFTPAEQG